MSYLFFVDTKNNCVLHPEVVKLIPSFRTLSEKEVLYIVLSTDYNSPYKQHPERERKRKAMWHAFDENMEELLDSERIKMAEEDYMSLQYNPKIEAARIYQKRIDKWQEQLMADDSPTSANKIMDAIDGAQKRITALEKEASEQTLSEGVIKGGMKLSYIEKVMANRKHFLSLTSKK